MRWEMKIQKIGRIQVPTKYLKAYNLNEGDIVIIEEKGDNTLVLTFKKQKNKSKK